MIDELHAINISTDEANLIFSTIAMRATSFTPAMLVTT